MPPGTPPTDGPSFGEIAELHREMLYRVALRLSGNRATADDLVQDALLRARLRFGRFQQGTNAAAWLATILTNVFLDQLKHEKVIRKAEPDLAALAADEMDSLIASISDADLHEAIGALEPELREVIELCYLHQMRYREVAAALKLPVGTIGTRLMRARARLRDLLTPTSLDAVKP